MDFSKIIRRGFRKGRAKNVIPPNAVHFLHVGKAAGTQVSNVIQQINQNRKTGLLVKHKHKVSLADLPLGDDYFFSTRDPMTRFKSGFYSRQRKGRPQYDVAWSAYETQAFERFPHANDLAEALFSGGQDGRDATAAIGSITHCSRNLVDWFDACGHLFTCRPPIWIIRQENFAADLGVFLERIGHDAPVDLATGTTTSHANNYDGIPKLSETAQDNLRRWYAQDYAFLDMCDAWMDGVAAAI